LAEKGFIDTTAQRGSAAQFMLAPSGRLPKV